MGSALKQVVVGFQISLKERDSLSVELLSQIQVSPEELEELIWDKEIEDLADQ